MTEPDPATIRDPEAPSAPSVCTGGDPTAKRDGCERCERCEIFDPDRPRVGDVCGACGDGRYFAAIVEDTWSNATVALTENISMSLPVGTSVIECDNCARLELLNGDSDQHRLMALAIGELTEAYTELLRPRRDRILLAMRQQKSSIHPCVSP